MIEYIGGPPKPSKETKSKSFGRYIFEWLLAFFIAFLIVCVVSVIVTVSTSERVVAQHVVNQHNQRLTYTINSKSVDLYLKSSSDMTCDMSRLPNTGDLIIKCH